MKDYFGYAKKVCVVTGAASGIGKATCEMLVDLGAEVYGLDWAEIKVDGIEKGLQVDLRKKESIDEVFVKLPKHIDRFFGVAGVSGLSTDYHTTFTIDFIANKYMVQEYLTNRMDAGGAIAFISSNAGLRWDNPEYQKEFLGVVEPEGWEATYEALLKLNQEKVPGTAAYGMAKRTLDYYVAYLQPVLAPRKIRVNAVLPSSTKSGMTDDFVKMCGGMDNLLNYAGFAQRLAESHEMAAPLVFVNSDMASFISGVCISADFGLNAAILAGRIPDGFSFKMLQ